MAIKISLDKFADEIGRYSKQSVQDYKTFVVEALYEQLPKIVANSPVDTGLYAQSWRVDVENDNAKLGNYAPYAAIIEFGARPFTPPIAPLLEWARRVLSKTEIDDECWALAKGVQNKISEVGMEPKHILTDSIAEIMENVKSKMQRKFG